MGTQSEWITGDSAPVRLILHSDGKEFGTGFAVFCDQETTWLVTCAHVIETRPEATLTVGKRPAEIVANGRTKERDKKIDLAVLKVTGLQVTRVLSLDPSIFSGQSCRIPGWCKHSDAYRSDCLDASVAKPFSWTEEGSILIAAAFDLAIEKGGQLDKGYSGSPVICPDTGAVFAVVATNKEPGTSGTAIAISHLRDIWPEMPRELLAALTVSELGACYDDDIRAIFAAFADTVSAAAIRTAVDQSTPIGLPLDLPRAETLTGWCDWLLDRPQFEDNGRHPLYDVFAYLKSLPGVDELLTRRIGQAMQRLQRHHPGLVIDPLPQPTPPATPAAALIEIIFEPRGTAETSAYDVHTFWHPPRAGGMQSGPRREHGDGGRLDLRSSDEVKGFACELLDALDEWQIEAEEVIFLFRLPNELMLHPFEKWPQGESDIVPLGRDYPVVVGPRNRRLRPSKALWQRLKPHLTDRLRARLWCTDTEISRHDTAAIQQAIDRMERASCVALERAPDLAQPKQVTLLALLFQRGVPIALWPRCKEAEDDFCATLDSCLGAEPVAKLPFAVRDLRKDDYGNSHPSPARTHLSLLWDDPNSGAEHARGGRFLTGIG